MLDKIQEDLQISLRAEKKALVDYRKLISILYDPDDIETIVQIIWDEKKHIKMVENLILIANKYDK